MVKHKNDDPISEAVLKTQKLETVFYDGVLSDVYKEKVHSEYTLSTPYLHAVIPNLINEQLLREVRKEILFNLHFTEKQTDIYLVHQTGDLCNLSGLDDGELGKLNSLWKLRNALYSEEFREYISYITSSGPLSGKVQDMSINIYKNGCHLLNHDDVIGTRKVSYILYLTDPDEPWKPEWGGALRLYPTVCDNIPEVDFTKSIPPAFNQLSFFAVQPGKSFHDVEEVYVDKNRMAISGWFHAPLANESGYSENELGHGKSSLSQLGEKLSEHDKPDVVFKPTNISGSGALNDQDVKFLSEYVRAELLNENSYCILQNAFLEESAITIKDFLNDEMMDKLRSNVNSLEASENINGWSIARPSHKQKYLYLDNSDGSAISEILHQLFAHEAFHKWLFSVTGVNLTDYSAFARRFRPGSDFTLAIDEGNDESFLELTFGMTPNSNNWKEEFGGCEIYMGADDGNENDPAVYKAADVDGILCSNLPEFNVLNLVFRDPGVLKFVKYCSKRAPSSRWDISAQFKPHFDDNNEPTKVDTTV